MLLKGEIDIVYQVNDNVHIVRFIGKLEDALEKAFNISKTVINGDIVFVQTHSCAQNNFVYIAFDQGLRHGRGVTTTHLDAVAELKNHHNAKYIESPSTFKPFELLT